MTVYLICNIERLDDYEKPTQQQLAENDNNELILADKSNINQLSIEKIKSEKDYDIYKCFYDIKKNISGFTNRGTPFEFIYQRKKFMGYKPKDKDIILFQVNTDHGRSFCTSLAKLSKKKCDLRPIKIDFDKLERKAKNVTGVTISGINDTNIKSKALYGNDITSSEEYKKTKREGNISSLTVTFSDNNEHYLVLISKKGSLLLQFEYYDKSTELKLVDVAVKIFSELLT